MAQPVSIALMLDKTLYAKTNTYGYKGYINEKNKVIYKAGDYIGTIYSWVEQDNKLFLMVYASASDYNNFKATFVPIFKGNLNIPELKEAVELENKKKQLEADQAKKEVVGATQFYIEKYAPWIIGAIVVGIAFPSIIKIFKNDK
jgi:hypothetical protein